MIIFKDTKEQDFDTILKMELAHQTFVCSDSKAQHLAILEGADSEHISIFERETGELVGYILLTLHRAKQSLELDRIVIEKKGKGYGHMAIQWVKNYCFEKIKFHRLWLDVFPENERAIHLYESEGFKREGLLRDCMIKDGQFRSLYIYSILKNEHLNQ